MGRKKRTYITASSVNPEWDASPFLFSVSSLDAVVSIQVLDSDITRDDELATVQFLVADVPKENNPPSLFSWECGNCLKRYRYPLRGVSNGDPNGELELEL